MTPTPLSLRAFGHRVLVALIICCVLSAALGVAVLRAEDAKIADIHAVQIDPSLLRAGGNYLIIGSDTRAFVDNSADAAAFGSAKSQTGQRSDTIMVAHIDPGKHTGVLVSFPRDLWVSIPGNGSAKINAAFAFGGPQLTIETIEQDFGIPISHYLEVDFAGFRDIVNAIGSVPIYFPTPARDHNSGLMITTPGCHNLNGDEALAYARSRYYEYEVNGHWLQDGSSDLGRIRRQQYFIRSLSRAAIKSVFSHPTHISSVIDKTVKSLSRDQKLSASDLRSLVLAFRDTNPVDFPMYTLPATSSFRDNQSVLLLDPAQAAPTLARLRGATPKTQPVPNIAPSTVRLTVQNGSGVSGAAGAAIQQLGADGFKVIGGAADADRSDYSVTEIRYGSGSETKAKLVQAYLGGAGKIVPVASTPSGTDIVVVLGRDFHQVAAPTTAPAASPTTKAPSSSPLPAIHPPSAGAPTTTTGPPPNPGGTVPLAGCEAPQP
jgi:polyisoprenyl-teichoic acid--peptidoglycan teichoic acid transferase